MCVILIVAMVTLLICFAVPGSEHLGTWSIKSGHRANSAFYARDAAGSLHRCWQLLLPPSSEWKFEHVHCCYWLGQCM